MTIRLISRDLFHRLWPVCIPLISGMLASGFSEITIQMAKCTNLGLLFSSLAKWQKPLEPPAEMEQETSGSETSPVKRK